MESLIGYIVGLLVLLCGVTLYMKVTGRVGKISKGAKKGIKTALIFAIGVPLLAFLLTGCTGKYFHESTVYAGLDFPRDYSHYCARGEGRNDKTTTSNLGGTVTAFSTQDEYTNLVVTYTHHSCVYSQDRPTYDAFGLRLERVIPLK